MTNTASHPCAAAEAHRLSATLVQLAKALAVAMTVYHLAVAVVGPPVTEVHRATHFMLGVSVLFCLGAVGAGDRTMRQALADILLLAAIIVPSGYIILFSDYVTNRMLYVTPTTAVEEVLGITVVLAVLEATRRTLGWPLVILAALFAVYTQIGPYLPYPLWHRGYPADQVIEHIYLSLDGLWGTPIGASASYIFLFVLFGALLVASGAGSFFSDLANAIAGRFVGGPAKTAVISSALMSTLSGSSTANVVTTGSFTIPAMKAYGYRGDFAAGVEALASTGGLITPPVMGAAAFIMADFLGVSYAEIMRAAIGPALLYFTAIFVAVDLEARSRGLRPAVAAPDRRVGAILRDGVFMLVPLAAIVYFLVRGYTPAVAGFYGVVAFIIAMPVLGRKGLRDILRTIWEAAIEAPRLLAPVVVACAIGGFIAGIISLTGLGVRLTAIIASLAGDSAFLFLLLTMIVSIVLGMGMPTSAVYIILAAILAPGLIEVGFEPLATHMFIFFSAVMSNITPPLAIASFAAAAVANADPWRTSLQAARMAAGVFLLPFVFCYSPALLGMGSAFEVVHATASALIGILCMSIAAIGWLAAPLAPWTRFIFLAAAVALIVPGWTSDLVGLGAGLGALAIILAARRRRRQPKQ